MKRADFVQRYADAIDRMMAGKAVRADLPPDFVAAWRLLEDMREDDYANVRVGKLSGGGGSADPKVAEEQMKRRATQPLRRRVQGSAG